MSGWATRSQTDSVVSWRRIGSVEDGRSARRFDRVSILVALMSDILHLLGLLARHCALGVASSCHRSSFGNPNNRFRCLRHSCQRASVCFSCCAHSPSPFEVPTTFCMLEPSTSRMQNTLLNKSNGEREKQVVHTDILVQSEPGDTPRASRSACSADRPPWKLQKAGQLVRHHAGTARSQTLSILLSLEERQNRWNCRNGAGQCDSMVSMKRFRYKLFPFLSASQRSRLKGNATQHEDVVCCDACSFSHFCFSYKEHAISASIVQ